VPYDLQTARAPRLSGPLLSLTAWLVENPVFRPLVVPSLLKSSGLKAFRALALDDAPSVLPPLPRPATGIFAPHAPPDLAAVPTGGAAPGYLPETIEDFVRAYREGRTDPEKVAGRVVEAVERSNAADPPLRAIVACVADDVRTQARESAERHRAGRPLSPLDGVPVAVKDELDLRGYPTTAGTRFLRAVAVEDAFVVKRLRAAGALLFGKANMHEIGIDTTGFNAHHGTARNPHDPGRYPGGSSSGSAAVVAAGLCPVAVGADGGGSIRIPSSLCGVVGLKATRGRVSETGAFPLCWSVAHVGPIAATAHDAALAYAAMAGPDPADAVSTVQPPPDLEGLGAGVEGLRLGVFRPWFEDADPAVIAACRDLLSKLEGLGARIVEVDLPGLEACRLAHAVTILAEMAVAMDRYDGDHRRDLGLAVRLNLALAREMTARDYVKAQQVRTRFTAAMERALRAADVVVTPATARTAPRIRSDVLPRGESDLDLTSALMRFVFPANLTGHPAIAFPAGWDADGMPVGMQAIGPAWGESLLLRLATAAAPLVERRAPKVAFRLLE